MDSRRKIYGFWHIARVGQWQTIVDGQLAKITKSGLYDASHTIFVNILGANGLVDVPDALKGGKFAASCDPNVARFEYPTLQILQQRARQEDCYCWYIHVKGATSSSAGTQSPRWRWREYMEYFVLENWRACVEYLADHDTVGVEWTTTPLPHYSGNFWWAEARYLRRLPRVEAMEHAARGDRLFNEF